MVSFGSSITPIPDLRGIHGAKVGDVAPTTAIKRGPVRPRKGRTSVAAVIAVSVLAVATVAAWLIIATFAR
ncbi:hypothetical protein AA0498_2253 [Acidomonas methanolica]|nr:hypothetical protein AA0498_2253 [Acidomonas methanolica]